MFQILLASAGVNLLTEHLLSNAITNEMDAMKQRILKSIGSSFYSVSVDEMTTKSMAMKCIGIVIHYADRVSKNIRSFALPIRELNQKATSFNLREAVKTDISDFGLDISKIVRVVTDGAPVMRSGFR